MNNLSFYNRFLFLFSHRFLTGQVDKRTLEKYQNEAREKSRESWYLSWALDTNEEERQKAKTVELDRAWFETEKKHFIILDAPGHKCFVPNMIGGAAQADIAILVVEFLFGEKIDAGTKKCSSRSFRLEKVNSKPVLNVVDKHVNMPC